MGAKLIGMKTPSLKLERVQKNIQSASATMLYNLSSNAETEMKRRTIYGRINE